MTKVCIFDLRPNHLLCIQKYSGHGYDEAFTRNMEALVRMLKSEPNTEITLTYGGDALCSACPNYNGRTCLSENKVKIMDDKVLLFCKLSYGETGSWAELSDKAVQVFESEFEDICVTCEWFELCRTTK